MFPGPLEGLEGSGKLVGTISIYPSTCLTPWYQVMTQTLISSVYGIRNVDLRILRFSLFSFDFWRFFLDVPSRTLRKSIPLSMFTGFLLYCWGVVVEILAGPCRCLPVSYCTAGVWSWRFWQGFSKCWSRNIAFLTVRQCDKKGSNFIQGLKIS